MGSFLKKVKSVKKHGIKPIIQGEKNYRLNDIDIELKALERAEVCKGCYLFEKEPIEAFKVKDERIKKLSKMMCSDCGCASAYLLRQDLKVCSKWKE